jgi:hypothetical protein
VLQNSLYRIVRTSSATLHPFAQNSIDFFRRKKPERIVAPRTGPTICHETKHRFEFARTTGCFGECPNLSTGDVFRKRASRGGVVPGLAVILLWATPVQSPALDHPSSLLGKTAGAEGPNTAARRHMNGEIPFFWSEHRPAEDNGLERPAELRCCSVWTIQERPSNRR